MNFVVIVIDGPARTGTSRLAEKLAEHLGIPRMNTGELYRGVALIAKWTNRNIYSPEEMAEIAATIQFEFEHGSVVAINGRTVTHADLRSVSTTVAHIAHYPDVRKYIREWQLQFAEQGHCVLEGRDLGSSVFPHSPFKIFLTCDDVERARRGSNDEGRIVTVEELHERDLMDAERDHSPMVCPADAHCYDTTSTSVPELVSAVELKLKGIPEVWSKLKG